MYIGTTSCPFTGKYIQLGAALQRDALEDQREIQSQD